MLSLTGSYWMKLIIHPVFFFFFFYPNMYWSETGLKLDFFSPKGISIKE